MFGKLEAHKYKTNLKKNEEETKKEGKKERLLSSIEPDVRQEKEKQYLSKRERKLLKKGRSAS